MHLRQIWHANNKHHPTPETVTNIPADSTADALDRHKANLEATGDT